MTYLVWFLKNHGLDQNTTPDTYLNLSFLGCQGDASPLKSCWS